MHNINHIRRLIENRFGTGSELGIYAMKGSGLKEVSNLPKIVIIA